MLDYLKEPEQDMHAKRNSSVLKGLKKDINRKLEILNEIPTSHALHYQIAGLYKDQAAITKSTEDYQVACDWYTKTLLLFKKENEYDDPFILSDRALMLVKIGKTDDAISDLLVILESSWFSNWATAIYSLGYNIKDIIASDSIRNRIPELVQAGDINSESVLKNIEEHAAEIKEMRENMLEDLKSMFKQPEPELVSFTSSLILSAGPNHEVNLSSLVGDKVSSQETPDIVDLSLSDSSNNITKQSP